MFPVRRNDRGYEYRVLHSCKHCKMYLDLYDYGGLERRRRKAKEKYWENKRKEQATLNRMRAERRPKRSNQTYTYLFKSECLLCSKCGSLGPKYKDSSWCKECDKEYAKKRREARRLNDPEAHEASLARLKEYYETNPKIKTNRERRDSDTLRESEWQLILYAFGNKCAYCDAEGDLQKDHVIPYSRGGTLSADNVVPACPKCNGHEGKLDQDMREWLNDEQRYEAINMTIGDVLYEVCG